MRNAKIISSIPGRVRVNLDGLFKNERLGYGIIKHLKRSKKIISVSFNKYTNNILIYYKYQHLNVDDILYELETFTIEDASAHIPEHVNRDSIGKIIISTLNPINLLKRKYPIKIFQSEYSLSRRIIKVGISAGIVLLAFNPYIGSIISISILTYPGILFTLSSIAYFYSSKGAFLNEIYLKNSNGIGFFAKTKSFLIEDDLLIEDNYNVKNFFDRNEINKYRLVELRKNQNLIKPEIKAFIEKTREYGVTDFIVFSDKDGEMLEYITYSLGIDKIHLLKDKILVLREYENQENITAVIHEKLLEKIEDINSNLIVSIYSETKSNFYKGNINIIDKDIEKLPWLLKVSKENEELIIRCHASAVSVNMLSLFISILLKINPVLSLGIYGFNTLAHIIVIKNDIEKRICF